MGAVQKSQTTSCLAGTAPSLRSLAVQSISGISANWFKHDKLKRDWPDGMLCGPPIQR